MKSQAMDGRNSFAWILDVAAEDTTVSGSSTSLKAGNVVVVTGMATSGSGFGEDKEMINKPLLVWQKISLSIRVRVLRM